MPRLGSLPYSGTEPISGLTLGSSDSELVPDSPVVDYNHPYKGETMKITVINIGVALLITLLPSLTGAQGNAWVPTKNIEIIAPAGPGSALDQTARTVQAILQSEGIAKPPITVINKTGGGQSIGFTYLNQSDNNGHSISIGTISLLTNRITGVNPLNYEDVTPIANLIAEYIVFAVRTESPLSGGKELISALRKDEKSISIAFSGSPGNHNHMAIGLFGKAAGVDVKKLKTVVFSSGGELTATLLGGHVDVAVGGSSVFASHVKAGRIKLVAVTSPVRLGGELAAVPTWTELGLPVSFATFRGIVGPKNMNPAAVQFWESALRKVSASSEWKKFLEAGSAESMYLNADEFRKFLGSENTRIAGVLKELGLAK